MQLKNNWTLVILKTLRFLTICVLYRVLKRLEEEEGGGGHIVTDFVTRVMRPMYLLKKSARYISNAHGPNNFFYCFFFSFFFLVLK